MAPSVGRIVHYFDREEVVNAEQQKRVPEPYAAVITRVHKDDNGKLTHVVNLQVFDPEVGNQIKRDVHEGVGVPYGEAHRWFWPPLVNRGKTNGGGEPTIQVEAPKAPETKASGKGKPDKSESAAV